MHAGRFIALFLCLFPILAVAQNLEVNILDFTNATEEEVSRVDRSLSLVQQVVNTQKFRETVLSMKYRAWGRTYQGFSQTSLSAGEVLESILEANENFSGGSAGVIDLNLDMYYEVSSTVGYTNQDDPYVHLNRYHHQHYSAVESAGNLFHEWLHKIGHGHSRYGTRSRPHSVPYKLGSVVAEMVAEIESKGNQNMKSQLVEQFNRGFHQHCSQDHK